MNKLEYIKDLSTGIETISYEKVNIAYPEHTHIGDWSELSKRLSKEVGEL